MDSSSFRTHQEGPEFPQVLPKGPLRFLGVTPNEDTEEKVASRGRGRPQRVQEPAPVEEEVEDVPVPTTRRRPIGTPAPDVIDRSSYKIQYTPRIDETESTLFLFNRRERHADS